MENSSRLWHTARHERFIGYHHPIPPCRTLAPPVHRPPLSSHRTSGNARKKSSGLDRGTFDDASGINRWYSRARAGHRNHGRLSREPRRACRNARSNAPLGSLDTSMPLHVVRLFKRASPLHGQLVASVNQHDHVRATCRRHRLRFDHAMPV
jgi:hypothetical protein